MNKSKILQRLWDYRELCLSHVYSEPDSNLHMNVMDTVIPQFVKDYAIDNSKKILDVGCGQGYGMTKFRELGCTDVSGLTLSSNDAKTARSRGFNVVEEDMSFQNADNETYDVLFARHSLEHSPYPLLTLIEFCRIMKPRGIAYIEMPSPNCSRDLESFNNHYAIMGPRQWVALMRRAGFKVLNINELKFNISNRDTGESMGEEVYEMYYLEKIS